MTAVNQRQLKDIELGRAWYQLHTTPLSVCTCPLELLTINRQSCTITEKTPTMAFSWLKVDTTAITFKTPLRHHAKQTLTHCNCKYVKLGRQRIVSIVS